MQVSNNMLAFQTVEDYEEALDYLTKIETDDFKGWDNRLTFKSMRKECESKKMDVEDMPIADNVLASVLNQNAEMQIQGKIFILLPETEHVLVYDNFKDYTNKTNERKYTFDDEVITIEFGSVEDNYEEVDTANECLDCKDAKGSYCNGYYPDIRKWEPFGRVSYVKYRVSYKRWGVYYTLKARIWRQGSGGVITSVSIYGNWENKKSSGSFNDSSSGTEHNYTERPYSSSRRLKDFYIEANFAAYDYAQSPTLQKYNTWTKRCSK